MGIGVYRIVRGLYDLAMRSVRVHDRLLTGEDSNMARDAGDLHYCNNSTQLYIRADKPTFIELLVKARVSRESMIVVRLPLQDAEIIPDSKHKSGTVQPEPTGSTLMPIPHSDPCAGVLNDFSPGDHYASGGTM